MTWERFKGSKRAATIADSRVVMDLAWPDRTKGQGTLARPEARPP